MLILNRNEEALEHARTSAMARLRILLAGSCELILALQRTGQFEEAAPMTLNWPITMFSKIQGFWPPGGAGITTNKIDMPYLTRGSGELYWAGKQRRVCRANRDCVLLPGWTGRKPLCPGWKKPAPAGNGLLTFPDNFYLPERISTDPNWLEFWNQPGLRELMDIRRAHGPFEHIGYWKERPQ